jgi:hypothetical protein
MSCAENVVYQSACIEAGHDVTMRTHEQQCLAAVYTPVCINTYYSEHTAIPCDD